MKKVSLSFMLIFIFSLATFSFAELYKRAPDVMPGTLPEMRNPEYWITKMTRPDRVVFTPEQIEQMNVRYEERMQGPNPFNGVDPARIPPDSYLFRFPGWFLSIPDVDRMSPTERAEVTSKRIRENIKYMRAKPYGNALAIEYAPWEIDALEKEMNIDRIGSKIEDIQYGIAVCTTLLRIVPSDFPLQQGIMDTGHVRWDLWNLGNLVIGKPVWLLHTSKSGLYMFILCGEGFGWVLSQDIALGSKDEIMKYVNDKNFIVCCDHRVPFYSDKTCTYASGWFGMGDRLPRANRFDPYAIKIPVRKSDGTFGTGTAWIREGSSVHNGWLPYTCKNIVLTAFRLLDQPYDWTGGFFGRKHEDMIRDIFACFGFRLPYQGMLFGIYLNNDNSVLRPNVGKKEQYKAFNSKEPFVTIEWCYSGHCQLYLGEYKGTPIVLDTHGYDYKDKEGKKIHVRRCIIGTPEQPIYQLERNLFFLELK